MSSKPHRMLTAALAAGLCLNGSYLRGTVAGHGVVPIRRCLETLKKAGYDGVVSYEFEGMEENLSALEAALAFLRGLDL